MGPTARQGEQKDLLPIWQGRQFFTHRRSMANSLAEADGECPHKINSQHLSSIDDQ